MKPQTLRQLLIKAVQRPVILSATPLNGWNGVPCSHKKHNTLRKMVSQDEKWQRRHADVGERKWADTAEGCHSAFRPRSNTQLGGIPYRPSPCLDHR